MVKLKKSQEDIKKEEHTEASVGTPTIKMGTDIDGEFVLDPEFKKSLDSQTVSFTSSNIEDVYKHLGI